MSDYTKENPFLAPLKERTVLGSVDSTRKTYHLVLDLKHSGLRYQVGDSVGIWPQNAPEEVEKILKLLGATGQERVEDKKGNRFTFQEFLSKKANLDQVTRALFEKVAPPSMLSMLEEKEALKVFLEMRHVWDFLEEVGSSITPLELATLLLPMMPRFYSVASSQKVVSDEVHLTVGDVSYVTNGHARRGVCSYQMCHLAPLHEPVLPLFVQPAHGFSLTQEDGAPVIMIGPGTGVAPFRGFMQERVFRNASKKNWLFFGEWHEAEHFFYRDDWQRLEKEGWLKVTTAFSRDQAHKIYVQHRIVEEGAMVWQWLQEGAYIYICGDAKRMAKDVDAALLEVIEKHGNKTDQEAKALYKQLKKEGRVQRDVY